MNTVIEGRITGDVVIETLASGKTVANIRIAENPTYRDRQGQRQPVANFYTVKVWNGVAEALQNTCRKGDLVKFQVNVQPHSYLSEKKQEVINELSMTASRFKLVSRARANRNH